MGEIKKGLFSVYGRPGPISQYLRVSSTRAVYGSHELVKP